MKKQFLVIVIIFFSCLAVSAQNKNIFDPDSTATVKAPTKEALLADSIKKSEYLLNARPYPLPEPNIKEIKFYHRYWRDINLTDPQNKILIRPGATMIDALVKGIKDGKITAYDPMGGTPESPAGDAFITPMTYEQLMSHLSETSTVDQFDKDGNKIGSVQKTNPFTPDKISGYRIKEDVYYDKQRAKVVTRIIGIAPLQKLTLSSGDSLGTQPLCWIRFKDCRKVLVTVDADNPNKKIGLTLDDIFLQRRFSSTIVQESNPLGARIKDYEATPESQNKEAARIEDKLAAYKKSIFVYTLSETDVVPDNAPAKKAKPTTQAVNP
ncbi:gliding motility protein GldN [Mucilaginibacter sp. AW1-3]